LERESEREIAIRRKRDVENEGETSRSNDKKKGQ
jgi:hypothetical protein